MVSKTFTLKALEKDFILICASATAIPRFWPISYGNWAVYDNKFVLVNHAHVKFYVNKSCANNLLRQEIKEIPVAFYSRELKNSYPLKCLLKPASNKRVLEELTAQANEQLYIDQWPLRDMGMVSRRYSGRKVNVITYDLLAKEGGSLESEVLYRISQDSNSEIIVSVGKNLKELEKIITLTKIR